MGPGHQEGCNEDGTAFKRCEGGPVQGVARGGEVLQFHSTRERNERPGIIPIVVFGDRGCCYREHRELSTVVQCESILSNRIDGDHLGAVHCD